MRVPAPTAAVLLSPSHHSRVSGTYGGWLQVTEGSGRVLVTAVGPNSTWGKTMALVSEAGDDETPLQQKLEVLAGAIGKVGFAVAICCFIAQLIK